MSSNDSLCAAAFEYASFGPLRACQTAEVLISFCVLAGVILNVVSRTRKRQKSVPMHNNLKVGPGKIYEEMVGETTVSYGFVVGPVMKGARNYLREII